MEEDSTSSISMYLSFSESESTMSTTDAFKTLTDMSGVSALHTIDIDRSDLGSSSSHMNSTLEANKTDEQLPLKMENKYLKTTMGVGSPLRPLNLNILKEYRALCSTPTKEQLMRTVDVTRGSEALPIGDLGLAFLGVEDDKQPMSFSQPSFGVEEDSKENTQPESGDGSTMSASSSVEIVSSIIERKVVTITEEQTEKMETEVEVEDAETTPKAIDVQVVEDKPTEKVGATKQRGSLMPPRVRYSKYEPMIQGNRPTRIKPFSPMKRNASAASKLAEQILSPEDQATTEIPKLLNRMLKITTAVKENTDKSTVRMLNAFRGRSSMLPSALPEKRPYSYTNRMSNVVKTTLNSPARKMARKSVLPTSNAAGPSSGGMAKPSFSRQSMLPTVSTAAKPPSSVGRKSMYPKPEVTYTCSVCGDKFRIKSLLDAHKRSHETDTPTQPRPARSNLMSSSSSSTCSGGGPLASQSNQCRYCDKKFALVRALHIHLMQNCPKIPPSDKKKLNFTELDHVEKAQLPTHTDAGPTGQHSKIPARSLLSSRESLVDKKVAPKTSLKFAAPSSATKSAMSAPTSGVPVRKKTAHAGVYRTPSKNVKCHKCKMSFKSIMEHIDHNLKVHPSASADDTKMETSTD